MKLCFDSIDEVKDFVTQLKGKRGKKGEDEVEEAASAPVQSGQPVMQAPQTFQMPQTAMPMQGFPPAAPQVAPQVNPLVPQILQMIDGALSTGQSVDVITNWFRNMIGPPAAQATLDQIKQVFIPQLSEVQLKQVAQQIGIKV